MHINDLAKVQQLSKQLMGARLALKQAENGVFVAPAAAPIPLPLKKSTLDLFTKIVLIELAEAEEKIVSELEALGVDADDLEFDAVEIQLPEGAEGLPEGLKGALEAMFGGAVSFADGGVVGEVKTDGLAAVQSLGDIIARRARR